jgi:hypothetical protein
MNKTAIKNFAIWARNKLIADIAYQAGLLGVTEKGIASALPQSTREVQFFDIGTKDYMTVRGRAIQQRDAFVAAIKAKEADTDYASAFRFVVEKVAYTWFNRLIAIRFMEVNDYLPGRVRVLSSENPGKAEPDMVTRPFDTDLSFSTLEQDEIMQMKDENKLDELFRMLFIKQCHKLHEVLPNLFEEGGIQRADSYLELLLTISFTDKDGVLWHLTHDISEDDFNVEKEGQVEIIGWMYQYYNTEPKDQVFANLKKNIKISKDNIPAATQLFTPDWIVRYMVENSLGRLWVEGHPNEELKKSWKYYLEEAEQEPQVQAQLAEIRKEYAALRPEEIKVIDPCMGSGHILVYLFDVLMQIYESQGWTQREAAQSIVQNNLYGLDIDDRAAQLAYFAVMMKARQYDRRFLERGIVPHVYGIHESNGINRDHIRLFGKGMSSLEKNNAVNQLNEMLDALQDAKEYGSILAVPELDWNLLHRFTAGIDDTVQITLDSVGAEDTLEEVRALVEQAQVMAQKYYTVITNPPYMGSGNMNHMLQSYTREYYPSSKNDLSTVCMEHALFMCNSYGYMSMINIPVWMFLPSYQQLRESILANNTYINMIHPGRGIFGSDFGTTTFVIAKSHIANFKGTYRRLFDKQGEVESNEVRELQYLSGKGEYIPIQENYERIPGAPVAYWASRKAIEGFERGRLLGKLGQSTKGIITGDNDRYMRLWWEVDTNRINFSAISDDDAYASRMKWFPCTKGGNYRKWYGNKEYIMNWENRGYRILNDAKKENRHSQDYYHHLKFKQGISWSVLTASTRSFRLEEKNLIEHVGMAIFMHRQEDTLPTLAFLNSVVCSAYLTYLSPTVAVNAGEIGRLPFIRSEAKYNDISEKVKECVQLSAHDWDAFETSWDFQRHPLIFDLKLKSEYADSQGASDRLRKCSSLSWLYKKWESECDLRFQQLKTNEEKLNRIFIDIYGLQDELTPEVNDKDVTVRKADLGRDIRSLISYAVGCMLGRYSLDVDGLAYAGGEWDASKYQTYQPDLDNCIPITDEPYFEDDIVGRFVSFIRTVYGEETLEENLDFIAKALGNKGNTSREVIRNYFLNDFIKDHIKIYQKRPIYWLFDSGKQNGFKALVYMHRWNADTVGNLRVEYLHRMQRVYEKEIERMQDIIDNSRDNREVNQASKRREKLVKQLKEARDYDAKIAHVALSRVEIDLDDGVKVNYEKVQKGPDGKSLGILAKI